ncbi:MAG: HDIG domain-containing metalloprotein [Dehalococcoidia bacterium]
MRSLTPSQIVLFAVLLAVGFVVALFPIFPRQLRVQEDDVASRTIRSPRDKTFESAVLTDQAREGAAAAVPDVLVLDPNIAGAELDKLSDAIAEIADVRDDGGIDQVAKRERLLGSTNLSLSRGSVDIAIGLSSLGWTRVTTEAQTVLEDTLNGPIPPDGAAAAQDSLSEGISAALAADQADLVADLVRPLIVPTQIVDDDATEAARDAARQNVEPVPQSIAKNQIIVSGGQTIDATSVEVLEEVGLLRSTVEIDNLAAVVVVAVLVAGLLALYLWQFPAEAISSTRNLVLLAILIALPVLIAKVYFSLVFPDDPPRFLAYFLPLAAAPMLIATLIEARLAIVIGLAQAALMTFAVVYLPVLSLVETAEPLDAGRVLLGYGLGAVVGAYAVHRAERTNQYAASGVLVTGVVFATLMAVWLLEPERRAFDIVWMTTASVVNGLGSGLLTAGGFAVVGAFFGVTTRVQLMELSQLNAPLLRRLQDEAPGTFHHSIIVGNLAERAADRVGADPLLVRVGCYYHDIGKIVQPAFYIENQMGGANPHDQLEPRASARIISQHVRAGVELAKRHGLPERVQAFIPEHHGTRLVAYFYRMASQKEPNVDQALFRYPGPKPQSRETALVMLADSTEAMVRASSDRSPERIDEIVEEVMSERLAEGELENCDLTLRDIRTIAESFKQTLRGVYHPRIEYPEPSAEEKRALVGRFRPGRRTAPTPDAPPPPYRQRPT